MQMNLFMRSETVYRAKNLRGAYRRGYMASLQGEVENPYACSTGGFADAWDLGWKNGYDEGLKIMASNGRRLLLKEKG